MAEMTRSTFAWTMRIDALGTPAAEMFGGFATHLNLASPRDATLSNSNTERMACQFDVCESSPVDVNLWTPMSQSHVSQVKCADVRRTCFQHQLQDIIARKATVWTQITGTPRTCAIKLVALGTGILVKKPKTTW